MRPLKSLISLEKAHEFIEAHTTIVKEIEVVQLHALTNRVAAENIFANLNVPPFRRAAMDGYAIKAESCFGASESNSIHLTCIEEVHAGEVPQKTLEKEDSIFDDQLRMLNDQIGRLRGLARKKRRGDEE